MGSLAEIFSNCAILFFQSKLSHNPAAQTNWPSESQGRLVSVNLVGWTLGVWEKSILPLFTILQVCFFFFLREKKCFPE